jgi:hypothetical protein
MVAVPDAIRIFCALLTKSNEKVPKKTIAVNSMFFINTRLKDSTGKKRIMTIKQIKSMTLFMAS